MEVGQCCPMLTRSLHPAPMRLLGIPCQSLLWASKVLHETATGICFVNRAIALLSSDKQNLVTCRRALFAPVASAMRTSFLAAALFSGPEKPCTFVLNSANESRLTKPCKRQQARNKNARDDQDPSSCWWAFQILLKRLKDAFIPFRAA